MGRRSLRGKKLLSRNASRLQPEPTEPAEETINPDGGDGDGHREARGGPGERRGPGQGAGGGGRRGGPAPVLPAAHPRPAAPDPPQDPQPQPPRGPAQRPQLPR
jgi:hypothetical protein